MQRRILRIAALGLVVLVSLCCIGSLRAWAAQGDQLIPPGASDVQITRHGAFRMSLTYRLGDGQSIHTVSQFFVRQGWRRLRAPNFDRSTVSFARSSLSGQVREIAIVTIDAEERRLADVQFARCVRVGAWVQCF